MIKHGGTEVPKPKASKNVQALFKLIFRRNDDDQEIKKTNGTKFNKNEQQNKS